MTGDQLVVRTRAQLAQAIAGAIWNPPATGRSVLDLARNVDVLRRAAVRLIAVTQGIDLDPERPDAAAKMAADMLAAVAEYERTLIVERTEADLDGARRTGTKSGTPIGRPRASQVMRHAARDLVAAGMPVARAARQKGVAPPPPCGARRRRGPRRAGRPSTCSASTRNRCVRPRCRRHGSARNSCVLRGG